MRGMDRIAEIRRAGRKPAQVNMWMEGTGIRPSLVLDGSVMIEQNDHSGLSDLRPLLGLMAVVIAPYGAFESGYRWAMAAHAAGASDVGLAFHRFPDGMDGPVWLKLAGEMLV